jgi:flavin reductase (DIM6/NTAB) family NADH-FMN oxidoreductase RutF
MTSRQDSGDYRRALAQFATGIAVVTTRTAAGVPVGITINSFSSVSLEPPLVLWNVGLKATAFETFRAAPRFMVNVLASGQLEVARRFATQNEDRFAGTSWSTTEAGMPRLDGCIAWFECSARNAHPEGDHVILVGRVEVFETAPGLPLIFHAGRYVTDLVEANLPPSLQRT